ncbi:MAG: hypothetical protein M3Z24_17095 [Chloroflexota bacterium]|nr:hypothetical protein [Chloroflexota bacterium]
MRRGRFIAPTQATAGGLCGRDESAPTHCSYLIYSGKVHHAAATHYPLLHSANYLVTALTLVS